jgi:hypothetical protein
MIGSNLENAWGREYYEIEFEEKSTGAFRRIAKGAAGENIRVSQGYLDP